MWALIFPFRVTGHPHTAPPGGGLLRSRELPAGVGPACQRRSPTSASQGHSDLQLGLRALGVPFFSFESWVDGAK